jgi:hypothetical protein
MKRVHEIIKFELDNNFYISDEMKEKAMALAWQDERFMAEEIDEDMDYFKIADVLLCSVS